MKELICIVCPIGCHMEVTKQGDNYVVTGNSCKRGEKYAIEELTFPVRMLTSTVKISGSNFNRVPVKTSDNIPKGKLFEVMAEINKVSLKAPILVGDIVIENVLGLGVNIVATKNMPKL